jgi:EmrB/QacA subfamily drug resistance transporter
MSFRFSKDNWLVIFAMVCGSSMIFLDFTILPVALPTIQKELDISDVNLQWIVNVYFLTNASFVIFGGKLGDIFGSRKIFVIGTALFGCASTLGGFAWDSLFLIVSRVFQGIAAALITPASSAIIITKFPENQRGKAMGIIVAASSLFLSLGPFIGGIITQFFDWRWIFFMNIFISLIGVFATLKYVPIYPSKRVKIDTVSLLLFIGGLFLITLGAMEGGRLGWFSYPIILSFIIGSVLFFFFYLHYRGHKTLEPFLDFSLFKKVNFLAGSIQAFIVQFLLMNAVFWAIFLQDGLEFSPSVAGFWTFCSTIFILITAPFAGYLSDKFGLKLPVTLGFIGLMICFIGIISFLETHLFYFLMGAVIIFGFSISLVFTPMASFIITAAPIEKRGLVAGIYNTMRFTGATLGIAVLGSIYTNVYDHKEQRYISSHYPHPSKEQKKEWYQIAKNQKALSEKGLNTKEIKKVVKLSAYSALYAISVLSLIFSFIGLLLVFIEKVQVRSNKSKGSL